ncbi:MAG: hypothetical protein LBO69_01665 [Ignavibacteria bacterium]|jgi:hypothetical protein|nr:hypothetical protein [Ignavibacteria bacterium]
METLTIELLNPASKQLLLDLEQLKLITINPKPATIDAVITALRTNAAEELSLEDITSEVEYVRSARYAVDMLRDDYLNDKELTAFTAIDSEAFYDAR